MLQNVMLNTVAKNVYFKGIIIKRGDSAKRKGRGSYYRKYGMYNICFVSLYKFVCI